MPLTRSTENLATTPNEEPLVFTQPSTSSVIDQPSKMITRSGGTGRSNTQAEKSPQVARSPLLPNVLTENRVQEIISNSMERFQTSISDMISSRISEAIMSVNRVSLADNTRFNTQPNGENGSRNLNNISRVRPSPDPSCQSNISVERPDKVSNVISNWRIKFGGMPNDIPIEDFIYRVNNLTSTCLNGDFELLIQFANLLFTGSALSFYWRIHRSVEMLTWSCLCRRLKERYQDQRSDLEIKSFMRRRRQRPNESFDEFLDAILAIADSLREPMGDVDIVAEVRHNLNEELKHELLHIDTPDLASLRKECHRHEEFFRGSRVKNTSRVNVAKKFVSTLVQEETVNADDDASVNSDELCVIKSSEKLKCWNCEELGHRYHDCLKSRRIFCYGCGAIDTYKPNCSKCNPPSENLPQGIRHVPKVDVRR